MDRSSTFINGLTGCGLWFACAADLAWPTLTQFHLRPSFLDLALVVATFFCMPRMMVFWGGATGLLTTIVHAQPVQYCVPAYAAIGLFVALRVRQTTKEATFSARMFRSIWMLAVLAFIRLLIHDGILTDSLPSISHEQLGGVALTFLFAMMICVAFVSIRRRSAWMD